MTNGTEPAAMEDSAKILEDDVWKAVEQAKELHDMAASLISKTSNDEQLIRQRASSLDSTILRIKSTIDSQNCRNYPHDHPPSQITPKRAFPSPPLQLSRRRRGCLPPPPPLSTLQSHRLGFQSSKCDGQPDSAKILEDDVWKAVEQAKELHDMAASLISKTSNDEQLIRQRASSLDSTIRRIKSTIDSQNCRKLLDPQLSEKYEDELQKAECIMVDGDASAFLPPKPEGRFLRMFLVQSVYVL